MGEFRLMTWNVQNLFPVGAEDGPDTTAEFAAKLASLAAVIDVTRPSLIRLMPRRVEAQTVSDLSTSSACTSGPTSPCGWPNVSNRPSMRWVAPPPRVPIQMPPRLSSAMART